MSTKKTKPPVSLAKTAKAKPSSHYHDLQALLHTVRCIAGYEDALCELTHEAKRSGELSPSLGDELRDLLEKIPSHDYVVDLDAVRASLGAPPAPKKSASRKPQKPRKANTSLKGVGSKQPNKTVKARVAKKTAKSR